MDACAEAKDFAKFLTEHGGSPFVASEGVRQMLLKAGFEELKEADSWNLSRGGKYFFVRNGAAVHAFVIGGQFNPDTDAFAIAGAHTDSPSLRMKPPRSEKITYGMLEILCETYGGGIWQTWFDRDLGFAGKIVYTDPKTKAVLAKSVLVRRPLFIIPTIAPHMDRSKYEKGFTVARETELRALCCDTGDVSTDSVNPIAIAPSGCPKYHPFILKLAAEAAGIDPSQIVSADLRLCDAAPASVVGFNGDYVCGQGIDNLNSTYCCTQAIIRASSDAESVKKSHTIMLINLFDHEETGSLSAQGARSNVVQDTMERILMGIYNKDKVTRNCREDMFRISRRSLILSADNSHALHPNFSGFHVSEDPVVLNGGPVIKHHVGTSYASDAEGTALVLLIGKEHGIPIQEFVINQNTSCGSTIGPMTAANTGIRTVDIGCAQLAMHSLRETVGAKDISRMSNLIASFFTDYEKYSIAP